MDEIYNNTNDNTPQDTPQEQSTYSYSRGDILQDGAISGSYQYSSGTETSEQSSQVHTEPAPDPRYINYANPDYLKNYQNHQAARKTRKKIKLPKFVSVLLSAALFGLVAAAVFIGTNELFYSLNGRTDSSTASEISTHHTPDSDEFGSYLQNNADTVAQSTILTNVDSSSTDVSAVVDEVMPAIVSIDCTFYVQSFFGYYETSGAGSGIILKKTDTELLIATNNHVVEDSITINVTFDDGTTAPAIIKGTDAIADLAVVAVDLVDLEESALDHIKVATLGNSDTVKVGQMAVAIGNAMGYGQSTTVGYISAKDREVDVDGKTMTLLQTDAAINPGNSGGALLNLKGEVIGINSVKYASDDVEGMGFAIPISRAIDILNELSSREVLADEDKGYLGVTIQDISEEFAAAYNYPIGVYISSVVEGGAADTAGLCAGDIVTAINGTSVRTTTELKNSVTSHKYGSTITVTFQRRIDGVFTEKTIDVILQKYPEM